MGFFQDPANLGLFQGLCLALLLAVLIITARLAHVTKQRDALEHDASRWRAHLDLVEQLEVAAQKIYFRRIVQRYSVAVNEPWSAYFDQFFDQIDSMHAVDTDTLRGLPRQDHVQGCEVTIELKREWDERRLSVYAIIHDSRKTVRHLLAIMEAI